ncbi:hypothetical protein THRCLA_00107 [Thraustotheca clavata]|uniref:HIT-type domain-containing protein n=1 Tax=Thraustotheca clavata TaxID=74557 RepID=A0A1W0ACF6_9STRA|nr:hypothetical protein THRCLA_00107 [Thraustotheca clavata]
MEPITIKVPIRLGKTSTSVKDSISVHESSSIGLSNASSLRVCGVCHEKESKYTCPRCNLVYCGVACYKKHGEACTEHFYKSHVESEMKLNQNVDIKSAHAMQEMIRRVYDDQPDEEDPMEDRIEQLAELMESNALSIDALTEEERAQFLREVADGRLGGNIELWKPWWVQPPGVYAANTKVIRHSLIMDLTEDNDGDFEVILDHPRYILTDELAKALESLEELNAKPNTAVLLCNRFEILFAYAYTMRVYNGDWTADVVQAAATLIALSSVLNDNRIFTTMDDCIVQCQQASLSDKNEAAATVALDDSHVLVSSPLFIQDALCDLEHLLNIAAKTSNKKARKKMVLIAKKVHFYLVFSKSKVKMI